MTLHEVKAATANLVFAQELADLDSVAEAGFFPALARAIWVTDGLRPTCRMLSFLHTAPYPGAAEIGGFDILYDLRNFAPEIASVTAPPCLICDGEEYPLTHGYVFSGGHHLYLKRYLSGEIRVSYRIRPTVPHETDDPDIPLALDEELCQLLPLLIAHYLLLDDDVEKANHYLALYREQYALLSTKSSLPVAIRCHSVNQW